MAKLLKQSTAYIWRAGPFSDATDGDTPETGLTIAQADIQISKNGGAFSQTSAASPTTTHDTDGFYQIPLTATDTNTLGNLRVMIRVSGALTVWEDFVVVPANIYDSAVGGTDLVDVNLAQINGSAALLAVFAATLGQMVSSAVNDASATTTGFVTDLTEATDDHYKNRSLVFTTGNLAGQARLITAYNGTTKAVTVTTLTEAPADNDEFVII